MADPFETRERFFYVGGEMTEFDVAAIKDYLGKLGLKVLERSRLPKRVLERSSVLSVPLLPLDLSELPLAPREEIFDKDEFNERIRIRGRGISSTWAFLLAAAQEGKLPLELRQTEDGAAGVTYSSAAATLELVDSEGYDGYVPTPLARGALDGLCAQWREHQVSSPTQDG